MTLDGPQPGQVEDRPYAALAPYFAQLFQTRGIRGWFTRGSALVTAAGVRGGWHLDVGAGTCRYSRYWARAGFRTVSLDMAHWMLTRARLVGTHGRLRRICGTIDCLRPNGLFDLATAIDDVTSYLGAQSGGLEGFLERLAPRLRRGGLFLADFITPEGRDRYTFRNSTATTAGRVTVESAGRFDADARILSVEIALTFGNRVAREKHALRLYTAEEIERLLRLARFEVLAITDLYIAEGFAYEPGQASYDVLARRL